MTTFSDIRTALESTLNAEGIPTAWENLEFEPSVGTAFVRPTLLPGEARQAGLGAGGKDEHRGLFQIDVFAEAGVGPVTTLPDQIANAFKRGSTHTFNGVDVRVRSASQDPARREGSWWIIPVIIRYYAFTAARS